MQEVLDRFALEIQRRQVSVSVDAKVPVRGEWDAARVDQVVTNLVSNALKYGGGRPIEVSVRAEGPNALVIVSDHGVGIQEDEQGKIFAPFARAVTARHHAGLGLGLWIAQQIVQASGGRIAVKSRPDRRVDVHRGVAVVNTLATRSVMIIDDDDDLRTMASSCPRTRIRGSGVREARTAFDALEGGAAPFLILLDLMMPGMSGWEFRAAQLGNAKLAPIPVVVVTAANVLNDGVRSLSDVEILRKPFELDTLLTVVDRYAAAARAPR